MAEVPGPGAEALGVQVGPAAGADGGGPGPGRLDSRFRKPGGEVEMGETGAQEGGRWGVCFVFWACLGYLVGS